MSGGGRRGGKWRLPAALLALCAAGVLWFSLSQPALVTGRRADLRQVTVVVDPNRAGQNRTIVVADKLTMEALYDAARGTPTRAVRRPGHAESLQFDSDIKLALTYAETADEVHFHAGIAYRLLETRGGSGDPGYTRGNAAAIMQLLEPITAGP